MKSIIEEHFSPETGSNYCKKVKKIMLEKLEREERDAFFHKHLKIMQECLNGVSKCMLMLDEKG